MMQLYFLSLLCNGLAGFLFLYGDASDGVDGGEDRPKGRSSSGGFRLVVGILAAVTGILKLFVPVDTRVVILGDLLPAVVGMVAGFMLVYGFYREQVPGGDGSGRLEMIGDALLRHRKQVGIACAAVAVLHFLFPQALFL